MNDLMLFVSLICTQPPDTSNLFPFNEVRVATSTTPLIDPRLLGTWISDKEKTLKHFRFNPNATPEQRSKIADMFGKLKIEFRENEMRTEFDGRTEIEPYTVIAVDNDSVVLSGKDFNGHKITLIHFEKEGYYVHIGYNIEFFKRILPSK